MKTTLHPHHAPYKSIFIYGFAIFAMFFGSGNLVFPLQIGKSVGYYWIPGFLGLFLTGILLPFLGLFVIKIHKGNYNSFFKEAGPIAKIILPLFTLSLLGSFGIVPRCITVAYGGMNIFIPHLPLLGFSIIFCVLTFFLCLRDTFMVKIIGTWMSPILLIALIILICMGIMEAPSLPSPIMKAPEAFMTGFMTGYQTMDLFAAFFFSALIFSQIQNSMKDPTDHKSVIRFAIKPSIMGASLLALIYLGLVYLGSHYAALIKDLSPESMLPAIANHTMGKKATLFIGISILFSCLTTAVALNNIYAKYLNALFKRDTKEFPLFLMATTGASCIISLLDFKGIAAFLAPALEVSYPGIIALTLCSIASKGHQNIKKYIFYSITVFMIIQWAFTHLSYVFK